MWGHLRLPLAGFGFGSCIAFLYCVALSSLLDCQCGVSFSLPLRCVGAILAFGGGGGGGLWLPKHVLNGLRLATVEAPHTDGAVVSAPLSRPPTAHAREAYIYMYVDGGWGGGRGGGWGLVCVVVGVHTTGCPLGILFFVTLRTARVYRWRDSFNRRLLTLASRRSALSRRQVADDQPQKAAGWRSAEVRVHWRPAVFFFFGLKDSPGFVRQNLSCIRTNWADYGLRQGKV